MTTQFKIQNSKFKIAMFSKLPPAEQKLKFLTFGFLLVLLTFTFLLLTFTSPAFAQVASPAANQSTVYRLPSTVSPTSPLYTDLILNNLFHSFSCLAVGQSVIGQPCLTYQVTKNAQGMIQSVPVLSQVNLSGGTLGAVTGVIGALYQNPPVRTADYLASVGQDLGIVKVAHAQVVGSGAAVLSPILMLWQTSRNISYVIMILIFIIIGLMVMFRTKINPQTVISAQAALPGLVIGLILITFSYFLAGLVSDMAFVGTNVVGYYFDAAQKHSIQNSTTNLQKQSILKLFTPFTHIMSRDTVSDAINSIWGDLADYTLAPLDIFALDPQRALKSITMLITTQFVLPFASMGGGAWSLIGGVLTILGTEANPILIASLALSFIATIVLIYAMLKLLLRLINVYITIIFLTITAPFQFLAAALPGRQALATSWIMNMLSNILAFPAVFAVLYFVAILLGPANFKCTSTPCPFNISSLNQSPDKTVIPTVMAAGSTNTIPVVGDATFPLFGGLDLTFIKILLAFGALIALPSIPDVIARAVGQASQAGQMIGQEIGAAVGGGQRYSGQFQQGVGGVAGQVGRLTNTTTPQLMLNPDYGKAGFEKAPRFIETPAPQLGQFGRASYGWRQSFLGKWWAGRKK